MSAPDTSLDQAFRETGYQVQLPAQTLTLHIDQRQPALDAWLSQQGLPPRWSLITACNPGARRLADADNKQRQQALQAALEGVGWHWYPSLAVDPAGKWPDEPGAWIAGMDEDAGRIVAATWEQLALVCRDAAGFARLVYL